MASLIEIREDLTMWSMLRTPIVMLACATLTVAFADCAHAQGAKVSSAVELARQAEKLKPGQWVWASNVAPTGPVLIYVDLSRQLATVYRNGVRIGVTTVSSGKEGHATPTGVFTILQKDANHHSNRYNNAPMPFQQRLTWDGVALHAGGLPGYPESHGCVHLPMGFARELFTITNLGVTVVIQGDAENHVRSSEASLLAPVQGNGSPALARNLDKEPFRWTPALSPSGPLSIIVSKHDQTIVVLRNGVEIGRSVAEINDDDQGSHVISIVAGPRGKPRFVYVGLPGHDEGKGRELDEATINRVRVPRAFYQAVRPLLTPGATILVTQSSVGEDVTRRKLTVVDAVTPTP
jgi:hypothetical protein